jgi:hypothetical protein
LSVNGLTSVRCSTIAPIGMPSRSSGAPISVLKRPSVDQNFSSPLMRFATASFTVGPRATGIQRKSTSGSGNSCSPWRFQRLVGAQRIHRAKPGFPGATKRLGARRPGATNGTHPRRTDRSRAYVRVKTRESDRDPVRARSPDA